MFKLILDFISSLMSSDYTCEIYTLNAGRGDATLFIETENGKTFTTMIDCGPKQFYMRNKAWKEFLTEKKIMEKQTENVKLNALILTHKDVDHVQFLMKHFYSKGTGQDWERIFSGIEHFFVSEGVLAGKYSKKFFEHLDICFSVMYKKSKILIDFYVYRNFIIAPGDDEEMYHYYLGKEQNIYGSDPDAPRPQYDESASNINSLLVYYTRPSLNIDNGPLFIFSADSLASLIWEKTKELNYTDTPRLFFKVPHHGSRRNNFEDLGDYNNLLDLRNVVYPLRAVALCILCFRWKEMNRKTLSDDERRWHIRFSAGVPPSVHDIDIDYYALKILPEIIRPEKIEEFLKDVLLEFKIVAKILSTADELKESDLQKVNRKFLAVEKLISPITDKIDDDRFTKSFFQQNSFLSSLWWRHLIARFYQKINAQYYIISCYTSHDHPNMETITGIILAAQQKFGVERTILITNTSTSLEGKLELLQAEVSDFLDSNNKSFISNVKIIQSRDYNIDTLFDVNKGDFHDISPGKKYIEYNYKSIQKSKPKRSLNFTKNINEITKEFINYQFFLGGKPVNVKPHEAFLKTPPVPFVLCKDEDHQSYNISRWNDQYDLDYTWFTIVPFASQEPGCFVQAVSKYNRTESQYEYYFFSQVYKTTGPKTSKDDEIMKNMVNWYNDPKDISRRPNKFLRVLDLDQSSSQLFQITTTSLAKAKYSMIWKETPKLSTLNINLSVTPPSIIAVPLETTMMNNEDSSLIRYLQIIAYDYKDNLEKTKLQQLLTVLLPSSLFLVQLMEQCKTNSSVFQMLSWQVDISSSTATFSNEPNNTKPFLINIMLHLIVPSNSVYKFGSEPSQSQLITETIVNGILPSSENLEDKVKIDFKIKTEGERNYSVEYQLLASEQSIITRPITFLMNIDLFTEREPVTVMDVLACVLSYGRAIRSTYYWPTLFFDINLPEWTVNINQDSEFLSLAFFSLPTIQAIYNAEQLIPNPLGTKSVLNPPSDFIKGNSIPLFVNLTYFQPTIERIEMYTFQSAKPYLPASSVLLSDSNVWLKMIGKLEGISIDIWMPANKEDDIQILLPKTIHTQDCVNLVAALVAKQTGVPISDSNSIIDWISTMKLPLLGDILKDFELSNVGFHIHRKLVEMEDMEVNKLYFTVKHSLADYWTNKIIKLLPGSPSISIQQPQVSVDISYPLEYSTNKSFISYTIDFSLKFAYSSPLFIRFSKQPLNIDGSDVDEKRFELFISNEMNLTPVYSCRPDYFNGIIDNLDHTTSFKSLDQTDSSPPTLYLIFKTFGLSSFVETLPCVGELFKSTELELMNISCVYKDDTNYTWDYLHFILQVSEFKFDSNIPLLKCFRFIGSEFDFECSSKDQWEFSLNTIVNIEISDTDFFQCAISLSYTTNNIFTGYSTFDFSVINEDEKFTLAHLSQLIGLDVINNIPLFNNLLNNVALIEFNCIYNSNSKDSPFELEHLSIKVKYTDSFTIANLTFNDLSVTVNFDLKPRNSDNEPKEYNISVSFTGTLNCLSVDVRYDSTTRILSGSALAISSEVGLKQTLDCFVSPNKDQSLENDAILSSLVDHKQFGLNSLKFEIQLEKSNDSNTITSCFLKSASIDLSGNLSIPIFELNLKSLKVEYEKIIKNDNDSPSDDIYSSARLNLIAILSRLKSRAQIHIECNKKMTSLSESTSSTTTTTVKGEVIPLTRDSLTFQGFIDLFSWIIPNSTDKINNEITLLKSIQIKSASIELTTETNQPWRITSAQCIVGELNNISIYEQNPKIILNGVSLCVEYEEKRDPKVFFYLKGEITIGGVLVFASYHWTDKQILTAIIEPSKAENIQLSKLTQEYVDNTETDMKSLPDSPTGFISVKPSSKSYAFAHLNLTDLKYTFYGQYEQMANGILYINKDTPSSPTNSYVFVIRTGNEFKFEKLFESGNLQSLANEGTI